MPWFVSKSNYNDLMNMYIDLGNHCQSMKREIGQLSTQLAEAKLENKDLQMKLTGARETLEDIRSKIDLYEFRTEVDPES